MAQDDPLQVGLSLELRFRMGDPVWYRSRIEEVTDQAFMVAKPSEKVAVAPGAPVDVQLGWNDFFYVFETKVTGFKTQPGPVFILRRPITIFKQQRRKMFRVPTILVARFKQDDEPDEHMGLVTNISGGGLRLIHADQFPVGTRLKIRLELAGAVINPFGRVVHREPVGEKESRFGYGVEFLDLSEVEQDVLAKFIFARQKEVQERAKGEG
ncbi:MAG: flagellar brake protein [Syntrophothermus sp.]